MSITLLLLFIFFSYFSTHPLLISYSFISSSLFFRLFSQHIISGISSNELIQYIQKLEEENQNLHTKVRELYAELRAVKVTHYYMI